MTKISRCMQIKSLKLNSEENSTATASNLQASPSCAERLKSSRLGESFAILFDLCSERLGVGIRRDEGGEVFENHTKGQDQKLGERSQGDSMEVGSAFALHAEGQ